jgi:hypothetical protein
MTAALLLRRNFKEFSLVLSKMAAESAYLVENYKIVLGVTRKGVYS